MQSIPQQLKSWRRRLSDSGAPDYCIAEHEQARDWADFVLAQLRDEMLHLGEDYRRMWEVWHCETAPTTLTPHLIHVWTISARMAALGGWFALSLEVVITGMLSIILLDLPALGAFFVGAVITTCVAVFIKGVLVQHFIPQAQQTPLKTLRRLRMLLAVQIPIELLLLLAAFVLRGSSGDLALASAWLFLPVTSLLSVTTPLLAGSLFSASSLLGWSENLSSKWRTLATVATDITVFRRHTTRWLARHGDMVHYVRPSNSLIPPFILVVALLLLTNSSASGQSIGQIYVDTSTSVDEHGMSTALSYLNRNLFKITEVSRVSEWQLFRFGDSWYIEPYYTVELGDWNVSTCRSGSASEGERVFRGLREARENAARSECLAERSAFRKAVGAKVSELSRHLTAPRRTKGTCTAIFDLLLRISSASRPSLVFLISDGAETCRKKLESIPTPSPDIYVFLVFVPSKNRTATVSEADVFSRVDRNLRAAAPWLKMCLPWDIPQAVATVLSGVPHAKR